jgi:hypothetical protein
VLGTQCRNVTPGVVFGHQTLSFLMFWRSFLVSWRATAISAVTASSSRKRDIALLPS